MDIVYVTSLVHAASSILAALSMIAFLYWLNKQINDIWESLDNIYQIQNMLSVSHLWAIEKIKSENKKEALKKDTDGNNHHDQHARREN